MPLYEYECDSCGHRFEVIQKFSDPLVDTCPKCGKTVRKLISSPAIQFKGTGWYITDYAKKDSTAAGKTGGSDKGGSEKSESSGSTESSSTPAASTPAAPASTPSSTPASSKTD